MKIEYSKTEYKPGTLLRRIYYYDDDGDIVMTDVPIYEEIPEKEEEEYDGPEEDEPDEDEAE
jgi:hypothetical protein